MRGRALPIGGLKEKLLAALRAGITTVIIPKENEKDLAEVPDNVKSGPEDRAGRQHGRGAQGGAGAPARGRSTGVEPEAPVVPRVALDEGDPDPARHPLSS